MGRTKVIIAGAGIGGLTSALCLHEAGFDVQLYESAREIKPLGVGINLLPHAVRVLTHLGLQEELNQIAIATSELAYYSKHGKKNMGGAKRKICRIQLATVLPSPGYISNAVVK
jgi:2-polyprenyl-6-methoxyphenol hydroxylase-like FAD-dependent oxidoreductase